jgi:hypothetical protein
MSEENKNKIITALTPEQEAQIQVYYKRYYDYGVATGVTDYTVKQDLIQLMELNGLKIPDFCFVDNIHEARVIATALTNEAVYKKHEKAIDDAIDFGEVLPEALINKLYKSLKNETIKFGFISGANNAFWVSFYKYGEYIGVKYEDKDQKALDLWNNIIQKCGYIFQVDNMVIITNRPEEIHFDESNELHNEKGAAIKFRRGTKSNIYAVHGVLVPENVIMMPELITVKDIEAQDNAEVKRIMMSQMGISKYLEQTDAKVLHTDSTFVSMFNDNRKVPRVLMQDKENRKFLVGTDGSTARVYYMQVPNSVKTCSEAASALAGFDESNIIASS